jgi:hypothetical protein
MNRFAAWSSGLSLASWVIFVACTVLILASAKSVDFLVGQAAAGFVFAALLLLCGGGAIATIVTGHLARREIRHSGEYGWAHATLGLIAGYLLLGGFLVTLPLDFLAIGLRNGE